MRHVLAEKPFFSLQGEGVRAGKPSIFIRYAGCNLRCQFGLKCPNAVSRDIPENIQNVIDNIDKYKDVKDLPVFPNYCDTYIGILPAFSHFWKTYETTEELVEEVLNLVDGDLNDVDVVFTGGEPMLHQDQMLEVISKLISNGLTDVTIETNGTIPIKDIKAWEILNYAISITYSISPKISSANYTIDQTCNPEAVRSYSKACNFAGCIVLKYVVMNEDDIPNVIEYTQRYKDAGVDIDEVCLMPCGGKADDKFDETQRRVFDLCVKYRFRYSPRLQMIKLNGWGV